MKPIWHAGLVALALTASPAVAAQYAYPAKGQDQAAQARDESECNTWAIQQTGFDPARPSPAAKSGGLGDASRLLSSPAAGAAIGALPGGNYLAPVAGMMGGAGGASSALDLGSAASAIGGFGGQSAGVSQGVGMVNQAMGDAAQPQKTKPGQPDYERARAACLIGRGYSVN